MERHWSGDNGERAKLRQVEVPQSQGMAAADAALPERTCSNTGPGNHRPNGPEAGHALTFNLEHSMGADQSRRCFSKRRVPKIATAMGKLRSTI